MGKSKLVYSSLTKKIIMAIVGLFLVIFLCVHLCINLLLLVEDGGEIYLAATHFMTKNIFIKIFEVVLFGGFIIHMIYGFILQIQNWKARPKRYLVSGSSEKSFFSKYMIYTGILVFMFLILHFFNLYFIKLGLVDPPPGVDREDFYTTVILLFSNAVYSIVYIVFFIILGFHLNHAFQSAFQTLGLYHKKYTPIIKWIGIIYSIVIPLGFTIIPVYFLFKSHGF